MVLEYKNPFKNLLEKQQFAGFLYEYSFKKAFLEHFDNSKAKHIKNDINIKYEGNEGILNLIEIIDKSLNKSDFLNFNVSKVNLSETLESLFFIGYTGYIQGYIYGSYIKSRGNIEFVKFNIMEGDTAGSFSNADLMFISNKKLYVIDFKLGGTLKRFSFIMKDHEDGREITLPIKMPGSAVGMMVASNYFDDFCKKIIEIEDKIKKIKTFELKSYLQVLSYASDYLIKKESMVGDKIDEVSLSVFYPLAESLNLNFRLRKDVPKEIYEKVIEIYRSNYNMDNKFITSKILSEPNEIAAKDNLDIYKNALEKELSNTKNEIIKRESKETFFIVNNIKQVRDDVVYKINLEWDKIDREILVLLHSAGAGKTTTILSKAVDQAKKEKDSANIILYFSPRKKIIEQIKNRFKNILSQKKDIEFEIIDEDDNTENKKKFWLHKRDEEGITLISIQDKKEGKISKSLEIANKHLKENGKRNILIPLTTQSLVYTLKPKDKNVKHTIQHIKKFLDNLVDYSKSKYKKINFYLIVDEFLGAENGIDSLVKATELIDYLNKYDKFEIVNTRFFFLDANGCSSSIIREMHSHYERTKAIPPSVILTKFKSFEEYSINQVKIKSYSKLGFPLYHDKIKVKRKFLIMDSLTDTNEKTEDKKTENEKTEIISDYIKDIVSKGEGTLVFIQNKEIIDKIKNDLESKLKEKKILVITALEEDEKVSEVDDADIILCTSSISRGVDIKNPKIKHIIAVISSFKIENYLVELIQVISRLRGSEEVEKLEKTIHLLYDIQASDTFQKENLQILEEIYSEEFSEIFSSEIAKKDTMLYIYQSVLSLDRIITKILQSFLKTPKEEELIFVPVPMQTNREFQPTILEDIKKLIDRLNSLGKIEKYKEISGLLNFLKDKITIYTIDETDIFKLIESKEILEVIMPYIILHSNNSKIWNDLKPSDIYNIEIKVGKIIENEEFSKDKNLKELKNLLSDIKIIFKENVYNSIYDRRFVLFLPLYIFVLRKFLKNEKLSIKFLPTINRDTLQVFNLRGLYKSDLTIEDTNFSKIVAIPVDDMSVNSDREIPFSEFPKLSTILLDELSNENSV